MMWAVMSYYIIQDNVTGTFIVGRRSQGNMGEIKYKIKKQATPNFDWFVKNIDLSTKIFKFIFFALFAHPNVPHKMYIIKLMYILEDHFTDLMLNDCKKRFSLSASIFS